MKTSRLFPLILALAVLVACSEDSKEILDTPSFSLDKATLEFDYTAGSQELTVQTTGSWTISSTDESWCTVTPASGSGEGIVTVSVTEIPEEATSRGARLLVTSDGLTLSVNVIQAFNPNYFRIEPTEIALSPGACDFDITVISHSRAYEITIVDDWITEVSRSGNAFTGETVRFHAEANPSEDASSRHGVVSVCTEDGSCIPVMVEQAGRLPRKGLFFRFTATWCGWCPYMDEAFHKAAELSEDFTFATIHASKGYPLYFEEGNPLVSAYKIDGYPTGVACGWKEISNNTNTDSAAKKIISTMEDFFNKFPNTTIISVDPTLSGSHLQVKASVKSTVEGSYKVVGLLLESGIIQSQAYYYTTGGSTTISDFQHDNIARKRLNGDILGDAFTIGRGGMTEFTWETDLDASWNPDNLSVLVWVCADYGDLASLKAKKAYPDYYIMNAEVVPVNQ